MILVKFYFSDIFHIRGKSKKTVKKETTFKENIRFLVTNINFSSILKRLPVNFIKTEPMMFF